MIPQMQAVIDEGRTSRRRSGRLMMKKGKDYNQMNRGEDLIINPGTSEVAKHMQEETHSKEDISLKVVQSETNWFKRGIRESIAIRKVNPSLNIDKGRFHLSEVWTKILSQSKEAVASHNARDPHEVIQITAEDD